MIEVLNIFLCKKTKEYIKIVPKSDKITEEQFITYVIKLFSYFLYLEESCFYIKILYHNVPQKYLIKNNKVFKIINEQPSLVKNISNITQPSLMKSQDYTGLIFIDIDNIFTFKHKPDKKILVHIHR